jgi:hypothetical protein
MRGVHGAAAGEDDLVGTRPDQIGDFRPRLLHGRVGPPAVRVSARRVAEVLAQERLHRVHDAWIDRRRGKS